MSSTSRHWFHAMTLPGLSRSEGVVELRWPQNIRYAVWTVSKTGAVLAYSEYTSAVRATVFPEMASSRSYSDPDVPREQRRTTVFDAAMDPKKVWELGSWAAGRRGRRRVNIKDGCEDEAPIVKDPEEQKPPSGPSPPPPSTEELGDTSIISTASIHSLLQQQMAEIAELRRTVTEQHVMALEQQKTVIEQQRRISELEARPPSVALNMNNNINIHINNFGQEDISFLDADTLKQRFLAKNHGILKTIEDVHLNDRRPENRNVRITSLKRNLAERFVDGRWQPQHLSKTVDDLIYSGFRINSSVYLSDSEFCMLVQEDPLFDGILQWMMDVNGVRLAEGSRKEHVVRTRQQVRVMLMSTKRAGQAGTNDSSFAQ